MEGNGSDFAGSRWATKETRSWYPPDRRLGGPHNLFRRCGDKKQEKSARAVMLPRGIWPLWLTPVTLDVSRRSYGFVQQMISISIDLSPFKHDVWTPCVLLFTSYNMFRPDKIYTSAIILSNCDGETNVIAHFSVCLLVFCAWWWSNGTVETYCRKS